MKLKRICKRRKLHKHKLPIVVVFAIVFPSLNVFTSLRGPNSSLFFHLLLSHLRINFQRISNFLSNFFFVFKFFFKGVSFCTQRFPEISGLEMERTDGHKHYFFHAQTKIQILTRAVFSPLFLSLSHIHTHTLCTQTHTPRIRTLIHTHTPHARTLISSLFLHLIFFQP